MNEDHRPTAARIARGVLFCCLMFATLPTLAALTVFTDRVAWQVAAGGGGDLFEDFAAFAVDTPYGAAGTQAGFLTLSVVNGAADDFWRIDVPPAHLASVPGVDGSTYAVTFGIDDGVFGDTLLTFAPVRALGFDYAGAGFSTVDGVLSTNLGDSTVIARLPLGTTAFVGLLYDAGETFTSLEWEAGPFSGNVFSGFGMGIDNVEAFSAVPLPATAWFLAPALGMLAWRRRAISHRRPRGADGPSRG
ncbi:MAG: hypothetical protein AB7I01_14085 [Gammaproteobacteria bacterium]